MGGAISKDPGRLQYRVHNIYLNFVETYGRLEPNKKFTIHQKALFVFWMSVIFLWCVLLCAKLFSLFRTVPNPHDTQLLNKSIEEGEAISQQKEEKEKEQPEQEKCVKEQNSDAPNGLHQTVVETPENNQVDQMKKGCLHNKILMASMYTLDILGWRQSNKQPTEFTESAENIPLSKTIINFFTATSSDQPTLLTFLGKTSLFGLFMFYIWLCDHLHLWPKVDKQYSRDAFLFLFVVLVFVSAIFSIKTTKDTFLNRDQTEEWKGWMQVQFVWYHYFDAQEVFNSIRCYIAAYVWMTGYGNFCFFWNKKDYSVFRLLKMMFRLNFLVIVVMGVTNSEFVRYYICAMHTYWFLSVWAVMAVLNKYNTNRIFMIGKLVVYALVNALIFEIPGAPNIVFTPFSFILNVKGNLDYWIYRSTLDHWTTLVGMIVAYNYDNINKLLNYFESDVKNSQKLFRSSLRIALTTLCLGIVAIWFYFILMLPRETYVKAHPYSSPIPVLVYIILRNMHPVLRTHYLDVFAWLGKITLETYLSQIHMYMIGDAKRILVYLPNYPLLNFLLATIIYILVSYNLFHLTVFFSSYLLPRDLKVIAKNFFIGTLWLSICYSIVIYLTKIGYWSTEKTGLEFLLWKVS